MFCFHSFRTTTDHAPNQLFFFQTIPLRNDNKPSSHITIMAIVVVVARRFSEVGSLDATGGAATTATTSDSPSSSLFPRRPPSFLSAPARHGLVEKWRLTGNLVVLTG